MESPPITEILVQKLEGFCIAKQAVDLSTGSLLYQFTSGDLMGSYDSRISIQIKRTRWEKDIVQHLRTGKSVPQLVDCEPYIRVEGSVHKAMAGHNCFGGSDNFQACIKFFISLIDRFVGNCLPDYTLWRVSRVDFAKVFDLGSFAAVQEWFMGMRLCSFPRRQPQTYGNSGLYFAGRTTAIKFYHKGPEFYKHDAKRVSRVFGFNREFEIQEIANRLLRVEVEVKKHKLVSDFGVMPLVSDISRDYLAQIYEKEVRKVLRDTEDESKIVRTAHAVEKKLYSSFSSDLAGRLLGTWYRLATLGEESVKKSLPKPTFYRHRKMLTEIGISWLETDVILKEHTLIPFGFVPSLKDSRMLTDLTPEVEKSLKLIA